MVDFIKKFMTVGIHLLDKVKPAEMTIVKRIFCGN